MVAEKAVWNWKSVSLSNWFCSWDIKFVEELNFKYPLDKWIMLLKEGVREDYPTRYGSYTGLA